jgi:solute carrier family 35 protein E1
VSLLCCTWYIFSALSNNLSKSILIDLPFPITVSLVQVASVVVYLPLYMKFIGIQRQCLTRRFFWKNIFPLAILKITATVSSTTSLSKVSVSYAHTVKALQPVCTVLLVYIILKEKPALPLLFSLCPIVAGVVLASLTEVEYNFLGMFAAFFSTFVLSLQNITSKKVLKQQELDYCNILLKTAQTSMTLLFIIWLVSDFGNILTFDKAVLLKNPYWKLLSCGFCNFGQSLASFSVLFLVSPVSYSVANTTKRIVIIITSIFHFQNAVKPANAFGMFLAVFGVALYNRIKLNLNKKIVRIVLPEQNV